MADTPTCPERGAWMRYYLSDRRGREVSLDEILAMRRDPGPITKRMHHKRWCTRQEPTT